jgi:hypothetical protein
LRSQSRLCISRRWQGKKLGDWPGRMGWRLWERWLRHKPCARQGRLLLLLLHQLQQRGSIKLVHCLPLCTLQEERGIGCILTLLCLLSLLCLLRLLSMEG